jgi:hypothetical protein
MKAVTQKGKAYDIQNMIRRVITKKGKEKKCMDSVLEV